MDKSEIPNSDMVGLRDRVLEGWLNQETGELAPGVPVSEHMTVVDVGCGDGGFVGFCASRNANITFIDQDPQKVANTEARVAATNCQHYKGIASDCSPVPLETGSADLVVCTEVLEHVPDPRVFLDELIRIAKPGGTLLITVPDDRSEQFVAATAPPQYFQVPNHIRTFSKTEFRSLIDSAGLEVKSHQFMGCFWSVYWPLAWLVCEPGSKGLPHNNPHPMTVFWTKAWMQVQQHPEGKKIRDALNQLLPKSQAIVARKPA